jgi:hypothetical protein
MQQFRTASAAALVLALSGCQNALSDVRGPMTGTWRYTVADFRRFPVDAFTTCNMEAVIVIRQEGSEIEGISGNSESVCTYHPTGNQRPGKIGGVVRGEVENGRVHVSDTGDWHCFAELHPTRLEGYLESYRSSGDGPDQTIRSGTCVLEKISDVGYNGPRT